MRLKSAMFVTAVAVAGLPLGGCHRGEAPPAKIEASHVDHVEGSEISKVTLTEKAMERLGVKTAPVQEGKIEGAPDDAPRTFVQYSSLMYVPNGATYVYTSPSPGIFVRRAVDVDYIERDVVVLKDGPKPGTEVVTVGAAEIFGTEFGVGH